MGYAQHHFQARFIQSVLKATLIVGILRIIWHTPLLAYGTIPWYDYIFGTFALQIICTWLYNGAGASVLIAMIAHLFSNLLTATVKPLFSTADQERYWLIMVAVECLTALGILIATQGRLGLQPTNERAPTSKGDRAATRTIRRYRGGRELPGCGCSNCLAPARSFSQRFTVGDLKCESRAASVHRTVSLVDQPLKCR